MNGDVLPTPYAVGDPAIRRAGVSLFLAGVAVFAMLYAPQPLRPELSTAFRALPPPPPCR